MHTVLLRPSSPLPQIACLAATIASALASPLAFAQSEGELVNIVAVSVSRAAENRSKLKDYALVWQRDTSANGFLPDQQSDGTGSYKMWRAGERVAGEYEESQTERVAGEPEKAIEGSISGRNAYNGDDFRSVLGLGAIKEMGITKEVHFRFEEDWLQIIGWAEGSYRPLDLLANLHGKTQIDSWKVEDNKLIFTLITPGEGSTKTTIDIMRGCCMESDEWYDAQGRLYMRETREITEVDEDLWLPVSTTSITYDPETGDATLNHRRTLDMSQSSFNEEADIPLGVFDLAIDPETEVSDSRGKVTIHYTGASKPLSQAELNARVLAHMSQQAMLPRSKLGIALVLNGVICVLLAGLVIYRRWRLRHAQ